MLNKWRSKGLAAYKPVVCKKSVLVKELARNFIFSTVDDFNFHATHVVKNRSFSIVL